MREPSLLSDGELSTARSHARTFRIRPQSLAPIGNEWTPELSRTQDLTAHVRGKSSLPRSQQLLPFYAAQPRPRRAIRRSCPSLQAVRWVSQPTGLRRAGSGGTSNGRRSHKKRRASVLAVARCQRASRREPAIPMLVTASDLLPLQAWGNHSWLRSLARHKSTSIRSQRTNDRHRKYRCRTAQRQEAFPQIPHCIKKLSRRTEASTAPRTVLTFRQFAFG